MAVINPPDLPPFIINGTKDNKYVCTYENAWNADIKQARRGKSTTVGKYIKLADDWSVGEIKFNEDFIAQYPELENLKVIRYKGGRLEFKPLDEDNFTVEQRMDTVKLDGGASWALNSIVSSSPIGRALARTFNKYHLDRKILSLAYFLVLERHNAMYMYDTFAERTWLPYQRALSSSAISRIFSSIKLNDIERFMKAVHSEFEKEYNNDADSRVFLALDSTSISSYSQNLSDVEYGHNKDLEPLAQLNILLIVDQKTGLPMYYRPFDGNVPDSSTVRNTIADCARLDIMNKEKFVLVADKGYMSEKNVEDCLRNNQNFIFNSRVKASGIAKQIAVDNYKHLLHLDNYDTFIHQSVWTVNMPWRYDSMPVNNKRSLKKDSGTVWFHIYYDKGIHDSCADAIAANVTSIRHKYNTAPDTITPVEQKFVDEYMEVHDGKASIIMSKVDEAVMLSGVRVLVSNSISDPVECAIAYEERNQVEYAFNTLKRRLNCNRLRVQDDRSLTGKIFVQMIATAISMMVRKRVKDYHTRAALNKDSYAVYIDSDAKLLASLGNIQMTRFREGWYFDEIAGKRRELFNVLNVPVPSKAQEISDNSFTADGDDEGVVEDKEMELIKPQL